MPRIIVVANQKGGVGKTTTVLNVGAALAELGQQVLLVDLDPQGGLTASCGVDPYTVTRSTYTLLTRSTASLVSVIQAIENNLFLLPGNAGLSSIDYSLAQAPNPTGRLRHAFSRNRLPLNFILIDTPPNLGLLTVNGLVAADELLIPVQCQYLSMRGVRALLETVWLVHERLNPELELLGVLPTMYRAQTDLARQVVTELHNVFEDRVFETVIADDDAVAQASHARTSVLKFAPASPAARAYRSVAAQIIAEADPVDDRDPLPSAD